MFHSPPTPVADPIVIAATECPELLPRYLALFRATDEKGRYLHFDQLRYRLASGLEPQLAWSVIKAARQPLLQPLFSLNTTGNDPLHKRERCHYYLTPSVQKATSETDRHTTEAALAWMCAKVGEDKYLAYWLNDLIAEEAISSSQLEGAAITTQAAKDLLKQRRKPRTPDEKMIVGNVSMMRFAWQNRHQPLSQQLLLDMHNTGVADIDNSHYTPGVMRQTDDVVVVDGEGNVVHTPPKAADLSRRFAGICDWVNTDHHDSESRDYLHPLIKAIVLHFCIGYEHPFRDGNGRVARALFYWYLFKHDFAAFRYITISTLLKNAPVQYGKSYLYSESDDLDLTYFIDYQCGVILRAIKAYRAAYETTLKDSEQFTQWLWQSGLYRQLSDKQRTIFQVARSNVAQSFTATNVKDNLGCSYNTAATALNGLVALNLFDKQQEGREWLYTMKTQKQIMSQWQG